MEYQQVIIQIINFLLAYEFVLPVTEFMFCWHSKKRNHFWLRCTSVLLYLCFFHRFFIQLAPWKSYDIFFQAPFVQIGSINIAYLIEYCASIFVILFCFDITFWDALFFSTASYAVQNMIFMLCCLIKIGLIGDVPVSSLDQSVSFSYHCISLLLHVIILPLVYFVLVRKYKNSQRVFADNKFLIVFGVATVFIICLFSRYTYDFNLRNTVYYINMFIIDVLLLALQMGHYEREYALSEKLMTEQMLYLQARQQEMNRESVEALNRKCHDMKHQIAILRETEGTREREELLSDLEKTIVLYDTVVHCGNEELDIILSEKSRKCEEENIQFSYIVDGKAVNFMKSTDIYALFGNALENAIEAVRKIENPQERVIMIRVEKKGACVRISVENSYKGEIKFINGMPQTDKSDTIYHGWGVRSIKYIAGQYGGNITMSAEGQLFRMNILLVDKKCDAV